MVWAVPARRLTYWIDAAGRNAWKYVCAESTTGGETTASSAPLKRKMRVVARCDGSSIAPEAARLFVAETNGVTSGAEEALPHWFSAFVTDPCEQPNGPPAKTPMPSMMDENATPNCAAMKPPDEMPDTEVCDRSMCSPV